MVLSNAERQSRYRQRLREAARAGYEADLQRKQIAALETAVNEARAALGLPEIQLPAQVQISPTKTVQRPQSYDPPI
jgi:hypothetical protein